MKLIPHSIAGAEETAAPARTGDVFDPATGEITAQVAFADDAVVDRAVSAAAAAFESWRRSTLGTRTQLMFSLRDRLVANKGDLIDVVCSEHGKVRADALGEFQRGLEIVEFTCGIPGLLKGGHSENVSSDVDVYSLRQPLGVVVGITPFNFPVMVPLWMFPLALVCGNTFILKPSERDPSASNVMARLLQEAGFPDGTFNVVHGDKDAVNALISHPGVAAVSSVGSTPVARHIYETAAAAGKRVQALGGAKNHMVVMPDADPVAAADAAVSAGYGSTGQRCMAISTVVAVGDAGDGLIDALKSRIAALQVGPASDEAADMGPLTSGQQRDRIVQLIESGVTEGADLVVDGRSLADERKGFFLGPCLFDHVKPDMQIYKEEIFGPVLIVVRAQSLDEATRLINENPYGNGTAIFTSDGAAARRFQSEVEAGMVGINVPIPVPMAFYSFGGWKQSLFGADNIYGPEGINFYTRTKTVTSRWHYDEAGVNLSFPNSSPRQ